MSVRMQAEARNRKRAFQGGGALHSFLFAISVFAAFATAVIAIYKAHAEFIVKPREATPRARVEQENAYLRSKLIEASLERDDLERQNLQLLSKNASYDMALKRAFVKVDPKVVEVANEIAYREIDRVDGRAKLLEKELESFRARSIMERNDTPRPRVGWLLTFVAISVVSVITARAMRRKVLRDRQNDVERVRVYA
jgi:hypothetical protein